MEAHVLCSKSLDSESEEKEERVEGRKVGDDSSDGEATDASIILESSQDDSDAAFTDVTDASQRWLISITKTVSTTTTASVLSTLTTYP